MKVLKKELEALEALDKIKIDDKERERYMAEIFGDWTPEVVASEPSVTVRPSVTVSADTLSSDLKVGKAISTIRKMTTTEVIKEYEPEIKKTAIKEFALEFCKLLVEEWETSNFNGNVIKRIDAFGDPFHTYDCFHTVSALKRVGAINIKELAASLGMTEDDLNKRVAYYENEEV